MADYSLGAHSYFFVQYGYDPATQLDEICGTVAEASFEAIEIHAPSLASPDWREQVLGALESSGLRLIGVSQGQPFWDADKHDEIVAEMDAFCDKLTELGLGSLHCGCSCGGKYYADRTEAENEQCVRGWTEVARLFRNKGHRLNYHTHGEPIEDIQLIVDNVPADVLELGPDLDWLRVGGVDPDSFIRAHAERLVMLHVRDYHLGGDRTEALGEGDADYAQLGRTLDEVGFTGEFVVELAIPPGKQASRPPLELLKVSREHLREKIGI